MGSVALFVPCYIDQLYPNVGLAALTLLERYGVEAEYPEEQTCCGQPMANSGCFTDAAPLARKMVQIFRDYDAVVCPSGSCTSMVRNHYAHLLGEDPKLPIYELCEYLHDVLRVKPRGRFAHRVGLHQSCHGLRELRLGAGSERRLGAAGGFDKPGALLSGLEGIELVPLRRPDDCCGFGGTFSVAEEAVSCAMGKDRIADHRQAGAEIIAGTDISCLMHMSGLMRRNNEPLRVMHVAEILAEATR
jgi:L-lactate dehydrogenase complex protein LldE